MAWIALRFRGKEYTAAQLIAISKRFLEDTGCEYRSYEIYDDCDMLMVTGVDKDGQETELELPLDELTLYAPQECGETH